MVSDKVLDAKGLTCPMPVVKTKKAMNELIREMFWKYMRLIKVQKLI